MASLSVVIPTHRRPEILSRCLERIERQTVADQLEVVVVSDGQDVQTSELFAKRTCRVPTQFIEIEKGQQGLARNRGTEHATAPLCLFIGDDIFLEPDACEVHLRVHNRKAEIGNPAVAVLGFTTWDPSVGITPVMKWLEQSGWQFGYPKIARYAHAAIPGHRQHFFAYTSHISLPTDIARSCPFREDVTEYGWEDIEWGKRLAAKNIPLIYEPDARALHHHHITLEESLRRMETIGRSATRFPTIGIVPKGWKRAAYELAALIPSMAGKHRRAFLKGMKEAF